MPELDERDHALIRELRELPDEGNEPDWNALERAIRVAVGPEAPKPWWRRWRWLVPVGALAATAAAALLWLHHPAETTVATAPTTTPTPATREHAPAAPSNEPAMAMWLGGKIVDLDEVDPSALPGDAELDVLATDDGSGSSSGLLPASDLGWVDALDDSALDRAETWLERKKG